MAYLDEPGLSHLWSKVTGLVDSSSSSGGGAFECLYYNESGTTGTVTLSATASKVLIVTDYGVTSSALIVGIYGRSREISTPVKRYTIFGNTLGSSIEYGTSTVGIDAGLNGNTSVSPQIYAIYKLS